MKYALIVAVAGLLVCSNSSLAETGFNKADYFYKSAAMGVACGTALLNIPYAFWALDNAKLSGEVTPAEQKAQAERIYALSFAAAIVNGLAFITVAPITFLAIQDKPTVDWCTSKHRTYALTFAQAFILSDLLVNVGLQIGSGIEAYKLRDATMPNQPPTLEYRTIPLWIASTALTSVAALVSVAIPVLGWKVLRDAGK